MSLFYYKIKRVRGVLNATFGGLRRCFTQSQHALTVSFTCISANSTPPKATNDIYYHFLSCTSHIFQQSAKLLIRTLNLY